MKKLIFAAALFFISIASLYYGFVNASKAKKLEQQLADYEIEFNNVVSENEKYKESIDKLESRLSGIENVIRNNP
jgi:peptidoglycan hydrolase CwlO-like protein